jgi:hypothetical protein
LRLSFLRFFHSAHVLRPKNRVTLAKKEGWVGGWEGENMSVVFFWYSYLVCLQPDACHCVLNVMDVYLKSARYLIRGRSGEFWRSRSSALQTLWSLLQVLVFLKCS